MTGIERHGRPAATEPARRAAWAGLGGSVILGLLLTVGVTRGWPWLLAADEALETFTRGWAVPLGWPVDLAHVIGLVTGPVGSTLLVVLVVVTLTFARERVAAGYLTVSAGLGVVAVELAKRSVGRTRPPGAGEFEAGLLRSFPSGHSAASIYVYLTLGLVLLQFGRARGHGPLQVVGWALVVLSPLIGVSRLVLGVHWPSDILAGWAYGSTATLAAALLLWGPLGAGWDRRGVLQPGANLAAHGTSEPSGRAEGP